MLLQCVCHRDKNELVAKSCKPGTVIIMQLDSSFPKICPFSPLASLEDNKTPSEFRSRFRAGPFFDYVERRKRGPKNIRNYFTCNEPFCWYSFPECTFFSKSRLFLRGPKNNSCKKILHNFKHINYISISSTWP